ncbi:hypothetical protein [Mucilaginibacter sp.]|uniref:hypothetical protein n=1 Tax=Mucilaginibacter sp. TaxID=1882438 RepID=UPI0035BC796D
MSETTLKRVFGFAYSKFNPSVFTIDVMAKYCGYKGWDHFCESQNNVQPAYKAPKNNNWETLKQNANKITTFTLQALKNKSGIPYNQTIKRDFIDDHFDAFLLSDCAATVFCAPSGYGKTVGLCHWIEERLTVPSNAEDDVILFFSSSALMNVFLSGRNLNDWVMGLLGYTLDADTGFLADVTQKKEGKFFLIIDGLDEYAYKPDQFQLLINQLMDVFSMYKYESWFKLVLTMRTATWINNLHRLEADSEKWYKGFISDQQNLTINVPLFNIAEIKALCLKINPAIQNFMSIDLAGSFNHPLYFQFYYKEHKDDFTLNNIDHVCIYELISTFILNKVYLGNHSADKIAFLKVLIENMDMPNRVYQVPRLKINNAIKQYSQAFNDLIAVGFIRELNTSNGLSYQSVVEFSNSNFYIIRWLSGYYKKTTRFLINA